MRRRSERKKSTDVSSPAPASRRTSRRSRKSPSESTDRNVDATESAESQTDRETMEADGNDFRASSEECNESASARKSRSTRTRTPGKERTSPAKRKTQRLQSTDQKIDPIPEEENNGSATNAEQDEAPKVMAIDEEKEVASGPAAPKATSSPELSPNAKVEAELKTSDVLEIQAEEPEDKDKDDYERESDKVSQKQAINEIQTRVAEDTEQTENSNVTIVAKEHSTDGEETRAQLPEKLNSELPHKEVPAVNSVVCNNDEAKTTLPEHVRTTVNRKSVNAIDNGRTQRKRKWITKKTSGSKPPIMAISTDSLKNLIADVHPVPLSDVQLESSSDIEEVVSEREEGEETPSPEREVRRVSTDKNEKSAKSGAKRNEAGTPALTNKAHIPPPTPRPPSPARNQASNVLYITNLVRPFTVLQLKGLLARTGKIVEDGFWIDRIKSKCYVQYETDDEASETRHALHGVRWPVSNPKCLNVDFGSKTDMDRAIQLTKDDMPKFGQDNNKDNLIVGSGWSRDRNDVDDKRNIRPVREWDVGKKETQERDKARDVRRSRDRDISGNRENIKDEKDKDRDRIRDRKRRSRDRTDVRSSSLSPSRKVKKKENDPPLRLLDDLFRKTKSTPCIYWLPLTPEQIAEKEAFRQKRIEEHKERIKQRELERGKERDKERNRNNDRVRDRERDHKRSNRSSDRRSRSRDRRRY